MDAILKAVSSLLTALNLLFLEQKLADLSTVPTARLIDGILLTKFDTIDDKVGACAEYMLDYLLITPFHNTLTMTTL
jgi:hypothetical protein